MKTITILIPTSNHEKFLEKAIISVLSQRGAFLIDLIILDLGSTDRTLDIIKKYDRYLLENCDISERDEVKYFFKRGEDAPLNNSFGISYRWKSLRSLGLTEALREGFGKGIGDILCRLEPDEAFAHEEVLQCVSYYFESDPELKMLFGDGIIISNDDEKIGDYNTGPIHIKELVYLDYLVIHSATFFTNDTFDPQTFGPDFVIMNLQKGTRIKKVNEPFGALRHDEEEKTGTMNKERYQEFEEIFAMYAKNKFFKVVSRIYRKARARWRPVLNGREKQGFSGYLFKFVRRVSYLLILGKTENINAKNERLRK